MCARPTQPAFSGPNRTPGARSGLEPPASSPLPTRRRVSDSRRGFAPLTSPRCRSRLERDRPAGPRDSSWADCVVGIRGCRAKTFACMPQPAGQKSEPATSSPFPLGAAAIFPTRLCVLSAPRSPTPLERAWPAGPRGAFWACAVRTRGPARQGDACKLPTSQAEIRAGAELARAAAVHSLSA